jgi:hypothetical protein
MTRIVNDLAVFKDEMTRARGLVGPPLQGALQAHDEEVAGQ